LLVVVVILAVLAAILFPVVARHERPHRSSCMSNLKQIGLAFMQYTQDNSEKLAPTVALDVDSSVAPFDHPYGWADAIQPYCKSVQLLQCPSEATTEPGADAAQNGFTDYWMNANLSRAEMKNVWNAAQTVLCGEGNDGRENTSARYNHNALPREWRGDESSPARRHLDTMNILFTDGHVKALRADHIVTGSPRDAFVTFALK